jgi:hypothetical protein
MDDRKIDSFWRDKEKENQSTLVTASAARYLVGYPAVPEPVTGLLYIMNNGIYFENFQNEHWIDKVFRVKKAFTRVFFHLKNEHITDVSCFPGQKNKFSVPLRMRLALFLGLLPRHLVVEYCEDGPACCIRFECVKSTLSLCAAYYKACGASALPKE